ncbi:MAG TPA: GspE/PulE family protein [Pseudomonadales bacterium]|nr:GspE/PulE family protein [Pseudomonadales bacterium]
MDSACVNRNELRDFLAAGNTPAVPIRELLVQGKYATPERLEDLLDSKGSPITSYSALGVALQKEGILDDEDFSRLYARSVGLPYVRLMGFDIDAEVLDMVPVDIARQHTLMPLMLYNNKLVIAMHDPLDHEGITTLGFLSGKMLEEVVASRADIEQAITHFYGPADEEDALKDLSILEIRPEDLTEAEGIRLAEEKPTVRMVHHIILDAVNSRASDIHIRPCEDRGDLLFRIDGNLIKVRSFSKTLMPAVVSRIKILSGMNIAEHRFPQDGQARVEHHHRIIDMRISVIPSIHGESVVIRILDKSMSLRKLSEVGFTEQDQHIFSTLLRKSNGMVLVTGPTGCGKSTTLYAALQDVITTGNNIITVEDPVEYHIDGLMQIQVNHAIGYSFARALRHILRHDPDVIMVGEIRDLETARMAVESSLTGHIVLSTLHTNSAATSVTRLIEMGIEPYLVNTSLLAILAQRLVRKNCQYCITEDEISEDIVGALGISPHEKFYRGKGCEHCHRTGYHGRMSVYELLVVTPELRRMIVPDANAMDLERQAILDGMVPLTQMALQAARDKKTSIEEVFRVRLT